MINSYPGTINLGQMLDEVSEQSGEPVENVKDWHVMVDDRTNELQSRRVESVMVDNRNRIVTLRVAMRVA